MKRILLILSLLLTVTTLWSQEQEIPDFSGTWDESRIMNSLYQLLVRDLEALDQVIDSEGSASAMAKKIRKEKTEALDTVRRLAETREITLQPVMKEGRKPEKGEGPVGAALIVRMEYNERLWYAFFLGHDLPEDLEECISRLLAKSFAYEKGLAAFLMSDRPSGRGNPGSRPGPDGPPPRQGGF